MTVPDKMRAFAADHGRCILVERSQWHYYRLGAGPPLLWLTGGLRRAALGYAFMERLAMRHTVIAPDYPPVQTLNAFMTAFDTILQAEGVGRFDLVGQSYGGMLAQAYVAQRGDDVERLILSSTGPADYGRAWLPVEYACIGLARLLPEVLVKRLLASVLLRMVSVPQAQQSAWREAVTAVVEKELSRADVVSHFAVAADLIRRQSATPAAFQSWTGRAIVMSAQNDPTQSRKDIPRYEKLLGRAVTVVDLGGMGHTAVLFDPDRTVTLLESALELEPAVDGELEAA